MVQLGEHTIGVPSEKSGVGTLHVRMSANNLIIGPMPSPLFVLLGDSPE